MEKCVAGVEPIERVSPDLSDFAMQSGKATMWLYQTSRSF